MGSKFGVPPSVEHKSNDVGVTDFSSNTVVLYFIFLMAWILYQQQHIL